MQTPKHQTRTFIFEGSITAEAPLATCSKDLRDREGGDNKPIPVPHTTLNDKGERLMYPSTGIRGALRRRARDILRHAVIRATGNPTPFSLDEHYMLTLGGIKGEGPQERSTVAMEAEWRAKNPLLSLFGAGDAGVLGFVHGRLSVSNAIARDPLQPVIFSGTRTDDFYRDKSQVKYLSPDDVQNLIARAKGGKDRSSLQAEIKNLTRDMKKLVREGKNEESAALKERIDAMETQVAQVKSDTGATDVPVGMPLAGWQAIPQGCVMDQRILLMRSNKIELGCLLHTLNAFALDPMLGAHYANGHGIVSGEWAVDEADIHGRHGIGKVSFMPFEPLVINGGGDSTLAQAWKAFDTFLESKDWDFSIPVAA